MKKENEQRNRLIYVNLEIVIIIKISNSDFTKNDRQEIA